MLAKRMASGAALVASLTFTLKSEGAPEAATPAAAAAAAPRGQGRAAYDAGRRAPRAAEKRRYHEAGMQHARALLERNPDDPEGLLWLAANMGAEALARGKLAALKVLPEMERLLLRLEAVAPDYEHAAAARTLARLYHKAPPIISIGSKDKARLWFDRALERAGGFPGNQAMAADFFQDVGDKARARSLAQAVMASPEARAAGPEAEEWREIARRVLED
jgi:hypothetical protein